MSYQDLLDELDSLTGGWVERPIRTDLWVHCGFCQQTTSHFRHDGELATCRGCGEVRRL